MKNGSFDRLRKKAELLLDLVPDTPELIETQRLFQELQVHQLELELQNDELTRVALELEHERAKFSSLFELAPVGYLVLSRKGAIIDINHTGSRMFGLRKELILHKALQGFVFADDAHQFLGFFKKLLGGAGRPKLPGTVVQVGAVGFFCAIAWNLYRERQYQ